jgi:hypothetical protein
MTASPLLIPRAIICGVFVLLTLNVSAPAGDDRTEQQLWLAAQQCSEGALRRYALSSTDPAEKVAVAAFDKCEDMWEKIAELKASEIEAGAEEARRKCDKLQGSSCPPTLPSSHLELKFATL